jgi:hypothetical protein
MSGEIFIVVRRRKGETESTFPLSLAIFGSFNDEETITQIIKPLFPGVGCIDQFTPIPVSKNLPYFQGLFYMCYC